MNFSQKEIEDIIRDEVLIEIKRRALLKKLNEINTKLKEYDSNLPTGISDPAESPEDPNVISYDIIDGNILIHFSNYDPIYVDQDTFVSFYEKIMDRKFPKNMDLPGAMNAIKTEQDNLVNILQKYVDERVGWDELEN